MYADAYSWRISNLQHGRMQLHTLRMQLHTAYGRQQMQLESASKPFFFEASEAAPTGRISRSQVAQARVTQREHEELSAAAQREGRVLGEWTREVLLREARKQGSEPVFTELIALRMLLNLVLKHIACGERMTDASFSAALTKVRKEKHGNALEVMQQYTSSDEKES
jgi:hypothetical protein